MARVLGMIGKRFGRLTVISRAEDGKGGRTRWSCACDCGGTTTTSGKNLRRGHTNSCGCLKSERSSEAHLTHGMTSTRTYESWTAMKKRCTNHNNPDYENYGGRGITVCERWADFENFYADMGERPDGMSIERSDNNGNYCPENCSWDNRKAQSRNRRSNVIIKYQGEARCMKDWAEELGINYKTLWGRLQNHPPQIAFNM